MFKSHIEIKQYHETQVITVFQIIVHIVFYQY